MKKFFFYLAFVVILCSCNIFTKKKPKITNEMLNGLWTEHWDLDTVNLGKNVVYVDTLKMETNNNGELQISCINDPNLIYRSISVTDSTLLFEMENIINPLKKYILQYTLRMKSENHLNGGIVNNHGETETIQLKKLK